MGFAQLATFICAVQEKTGLESYGKLGNFAEFASYQKQGPMVYVVLVMNFIGGLGDIAHFPL